MLQHWAHEAFLLINYDAYRRNVLFQQYVNITLTQFNNKTKCFASEWKQLRSAYMDLYAYERAVIGTATSKSILSEHLLFYVKVLMPTWGQTIKVYL